MSRINELIPERLSRYVAIGGLIAYIVGSIWALVSHQPSMFQRFGAIGVAAAVLFFTDRLMQVELNRQRTVERILHEYGLELEVMKEGVEPKDIPAKGFVTDYLEEEGHFMHLRNRAERINSLNVFLLTVATLQWGFGDAFLMWIWS